MNKNNLMKILAISFLNINCINPVFESAHHANVVKGHQGENFDPYHPGIDHVPIGFEQFIKSDLSIPNMREEIDEARKKFKEDPRNLSAIFFNLSTQAQSFFYSLEQANAEKILSAASSEKFQATSKTIEIKTDQDFERLLQGGVWNPEMAQYFCMLNPSYEPHGAFIKDRKSGLIVANLARLGHRNSRLVYVYFAYYLKNMNLLQIAQDIKEELSIAFRKAMEVVGEAATKVDKFALEARLRVISSDTFVFFAKTVDKVKKDAEEAADKVKKAVNEAVNEAGQKLDRGVNRLAELAIEASRVNPYLVQAMFV